MPFTYYYNSQNLNLPKGGTSGPSINFGLLFVIGGVATFFIILIRVITKIMRRRSDRNDVQFELSDQNNTTRNNNTAATANNTVNSTGNSQLA